MSIEAMKLALEHIEGNYTVSAEDAIKALEEALAKQEQGEPVGWIDSKGNMICTKINESCRPLYTHPQPKQEQGEPVQVTIKDFVKAVEGKEDLMGRPVYWAQWPNGNTTPQPRKPIKFPTMLRKMWSGGEVQAWLDENVNKE